MSINRRATPFVTLAATVVAAVAMIRCGGSSSPTVPTTLAVLSSVTLNATSIAAGSSGQGTVSLTAAAPTGGASISLSSSNPAVATVQTPVTIPAGSSSATFTITAVAVGTVTITASASLNGSSSQSPTLTVTAGPTLSLISLSTPSVVGGNSVNGTVILTAAAPAGGAVVSLSGSGPVTVPASVTVPAGSASATFTILTTVVGSAGTGTINASYGGGSKSATLSVTPPTVATASFGVTGPSTTETCELANSGNTLNCTFNGSSSTAPGTITAWDWSYGVAPATTSVPNQPGPTLTNPGFNCSLLPAPPLPAGEPWFTLIVTLKIHDDRGNVGEATNPGVRLLPQGACGF